MGLTVLSAALVLLTACGGSGSPPQASSTPAPPSPASAASPTGSTNSTKPTAVPSIAAERVATVPPVATVPAATVPAATPANPPVAAREPVVVQIRDYTYEPSAPTVAVGQPIAIVNDDSVAHTWSAAPGSGWTYTSGNLEPGHRTTFPGFTKPGRYRFLCYYHAEMPSMNGVATISAAP